MLNNFFEPRHQSDPRLVEQVKSWVHQALHPDEDTSIMVTELRCSEPGCPPIETVIALLKTAHPTSQYKIHKTIAEITQEDIATLTQPTD
ncbi:MULTISPECIES: hypothetical protein [Ktedonobacter]|uniref:Nitrate reductase n=2 Tax=Ktedonobacter TaxID=363276 RepID=D6U1U1_KTERA|nr:MULTISPECIES: hypothetical protein [Ktedonobacter]EFH80825.1 conserved hypothetical protein [Ktedonobacter racemifer DSM 44963]GHO60768.1 hypothetical protein KSB_92430 [Ktedonobacter robiniae]